MKPITLATAACTLVLSTTVDAQLKARAFSFDSGTPSNSNWKDLQLGVHYTILMDGSINVTGTPAPDPGEEITSIWFYRETATEDLARIVIEFDATGLVCVVAGPTQFPDSVSIDPTIELSDAANDWAGLGGTHGGWP